MAVRVLQGDCRQMLATLEPESVQCVVSSPPYFSLRSYLPAGHPDKAKEIGAERSAAEYVQALVEVFREVRRVLRPDGVVWLNLGDSYASDTKGSGGTGKSGLRKDGRDEQSRLRSADLSISHQKFDPRRISHGLKPKDLLMIPARVAIALQEDGWHLRSDIIWHKLNPMPESVRDRPTSAHEHVFLLTRSANYFYDADAVREPLSEWSAKALTSDWTRRTRNACPDRNDGMGQGNDSVGSSYAAKVNPAGRNLRNVWSLASEPFAEAHFAVMPASLAEICIKAGTSEKGCCPACKAPWARVTEREKGVAPEPAGYCADLHASSPHMTHGKGSPNAVAFTNSMQLTPRGGVATRHLGWQPSCSCRDAGDPVPCAVLDPFAGAFTVPLVADRLQRHAVGIELNEAYCAMARARLIGDAPLFAEVA